MPASNSLVERTYTCLKCDFWGSSRKVLEEHSKQHNFKKVYRCFKCDFKTTVSRHALYRHKGTSHDMTKKACPYCSFKTQDTSKLKLHVVNHTSEKTFECHLCPFYAKRAEALELHLKAQHVIARQFKFSCSFCEDKFYRKSEFKCHVRTHTGKTPFRCPDCKKTFTIKSSLVRHREGNRCEENPDFTNELKRLQEIYPAKLGLKQAKLAPDEITRLSFGITRKVEVPVLLPAPALENWTPGTNVYSAIYCNLCDFRATSRQGWLRHWEHQHSEKKMYNCRNCPYKTPRQDRLKEHLVVAHAINLGAICRYCDFKCDTDEDMVTHLKTHSGTRPFICILCCSAFKSSEYLSKHLRRHVGEAEFSCSECNFKCMCKSELKRHERVHQK